MMYIYLEVSTPVLCNWVSPLALQSICWDKLLRISVRFLCSSGMVFFVSNKVHFLPFLRRAALRKIHVITPLLLRYAKRKKIWLYTWTCTGIWLEESQERFQASHESHFNRGFAEDLVLAQVCFLQSVSYVHRCNTNPRKHIYCGGKSGPKCHF